MKQYLLLFLFTIVTITAFSQDKNRLDKLNSPYSTAYTHLYYLQAESYDAEKSAKTLRNNPKNAEELAIQLKQILDDTSNNAFVHVPMDIRFLKKDDAWLSYASDEDVVTMGCVCRDSPVADDYQAFDKVEEIFLKYGGRPHWAKRFKVKHDGLAVLYPKWEAFKTLRKELDPTDKFLNPYLLKIFTK